MEQNDDEVRDEFLEAKEIKAAERQGKEWGDL